LSFSFLSFALSIMEIEFMEANNKSGPLVQLAFRGFVSVQQAAAAAASRSKLLEM